MNTPYVVDLSRKAIDVVTARQETDAERAERRGHLRNLAKAIRGLADLVESDDFADRASDEVALVIACVVSELQAWRLASFDSVVRAGLARLAQKGG